MAAAKILGSIAGAFTFAFAADHIIKAFALVMHLFREVRPQRLFRTRNGGQTDKKFQAWPRTAGPPVVMNPISRQNFIVKSRDS